jgi:hypothetical protein
MIKGFSSFSIQPCMGPFWTRVLLMSRRNERRCKFTAPADVSTIWIMRYEGSVALHATHALLPLVAGLNALTQFASFS